MARAKIFYTKTCEECSGTGTVILNQLYHSQVWRIPSVCNICKGRRIVFDRERTDAESS